MAAALGAVLFALSGYIGVRLAESIGMLQRFEDGPAPGEPPVKWLIAGCALLGAVVTARATTGPEIAVPAILCVALAAIWCTDVRYGIVPDAFTLGPLGAILAYALFTHQWIVIASALVPLVPFAAAAALSHGRGMGWGDVKLAALGGAVLGAETATFAFALSCIAAVAVAFARGRRHDPIAFAPYLVCAIAAAMPLGTQV